MAVIIGLMSGTSADGVDAAAFDIRRRKGGISIRFIAAARTPYPAPLTRRILDSSHAGTPVEVVMALDVEVGKVFGAAAQKLMRLPAMRGIKPDMIASHGQTIHHMPEVGCTLQIGSAAIIAAMTGAPVWSDFRRADMAAGGQGAPLAPVAHLPLFGHPKESRAVVNIGGIANLTYIPAGAKSLQELTAFDTGPGNMLIDIGAKELSGKPFDKNGRLAAGGKVDDALLRRALAHPYFARRWPKSTGRDVFGAPFIQWLFPSVRVKWNADLAATVTELTAASIAVEVKKLAKAGKRTDRIILCGGGARNGYLVKRLSALCAPIPVDVSSSHGIDPGHVETALMAILAHHADRGDALDLSSITGARRPARLGVFTPAP